MRQYRLDRFGALKWTSYLFTVEERWKCCFPSLPRWLTFRSCKGSSRFRFSCPFSHWERSSGARQKRVVYELCITLRSGARAALRRASSCFEAGEKLRARRLHIKTQPFESRARKPIYFPQRTGWPFFDGLWRDKGAKSFLSRNSYFLQTFVAASTQRVVLSSRRQE